MNITFFSTSQIGARVSNQDATGAQLNAQFGTFVVCDGVAGSPGGGRAAEIARDTLLSQAASHDALSPLQTEQMVAACEQAIRAAQLAEPALNKMSTTFAALFIDRPGQRAWWCHAGDTRVYHFRRGVVHGMTRDHSLVQKLRDAGYENTGVNSHLLYSALGTDGTRPHDYSAVLPLEDGDVFLLCSDGFWNNLTPVEMEQALRMVNSPQEWLALMQKAIDRSEKKDNLSAVAVWCGSPQDTTLLFSLTDSARFLPPRD
ncbi:PP2C family protein-serine/threonine phosphatase [Erwinia sp. SLM-02]|uniref:PP2C family protein-serine/threonine phosphatase n=1 Tax=Erwinia sp. SLM-02 TaxID=3020057 RepID=UPI0028D3C065|nr:PP2C family serine/threonine-protein phosphatase [uncultured Erwinia sp.]